MGAKCLSWLLEFASSDNRWCCAPFSFLSSVCVGRGLAKITKATLSVCQFLRAADGCLKTADIARQFRGLRCEIEMPARLPLLRKLCRRDSAPDSSSSRQGQQPSAAPRPLAVLPLLPTCHLSPVRVLCLLTTLKWNPFALAGVAQWIECQPANQEVDGLIPSQGTCLGCGPGPQ